MTDPAIVAAFTVALDEAERWVGATAPNPPVGCAALDANGRILAVAAHRRAGSAHAEVLALDQCRASGTLSTLHTLVVTLEPCNHHGRTPPCTAAILAAGVREVWVGAIDPNPRVAGHGLAALAEGGVRVHRLQDRSDATSRTEAARCRKLIVPFAKWAQTGLPWVTLKQAIDSAGSMIPPAGSKTFSSHASLVLAHEMRKRADAILTGIGTVLADAPEFTVRHVADHSDRRRLLLVMDRRHRTPLYYLADAAARGFEVYVENDLSAALAVAGEAGALTLLVEAGPEITAAVLKEQLWDECTTITVQRDGTPDEVDVRYRQIGPPDWLIAGASHRGTRSPNPVSNSRRVGKPRCIKNC